jgi:PKD repeat protein
MKRLILSLLLVVAMVGVVSADTLIVYPTIDGRLRENDAGATFTAMQALPGEVASSSDAAELLYLGAHASTANRYVQMRRIAFSWNTSSIPDDGTIDSWTFNVQSTISNNYVGTFSNLANYTVVNGSLADPTALVIGDYARAGHVELTNRISNTSWIRNDTAGSTNRNIFTANTDGKLAINKTGHTVFFLTTGYDAISSDPGWVGGGTFGTTVYTVNHANSLYHPVLTITYNSVIAPVSSFTCTKNFLRIPNSVTCTDTSTNTPTSWSWNWGDGSSASTTQNPSHTYTKRGKWDIVLTATNAGGSGVSGVTAVKVTGYENYW